MFLANRHRVSRHFGNIIAAIFIMSLMLLDELIQESDLIDRFPFFSDITLTADLLIWPFVAFYVQSIVGKRSQYRLRDLIFFLPFLIGFIWQIPYTFSSGELKTEYFNSGIPAPLALFVLYKFCVALAFLAWIFTMLNRRLKLFIQPFRESKKTKPIQQFRGFIAVVTLAIFMIYTAFFLNFWGVDFEPESDKIGSLLIMGSFYFMGIITFRRPPELVSEGYSAAVVSSFNQNEESHIDQLQSLFESQQPFLRELRIKEIADQLNLTVQQLSYLINQHIGLSFQDFVNTYRVNHFKAAVQNGEHREKTLLGIALESGFSSKATFNRAFKNIEGISPSAYVEKQDSNSI